jgi:N-acetylglucosamine-6-sulfatase
MRRGTFPLLALALVAVALVLGLAFVGGTTAEEPGPEPRGAQVVRPNILLIVTDDQRADTLRYMPNVRHLLMRRGITFTNGYVVNPTCCPSRASILTGNYSHTTKVYATKPRQPYGGFPAFEDETTIATMLHDGGYRTGLFGKYLNGYDTDYVPPGWDRWFATFGGDGGYYDYRASSDGRLVRFGHAPSDYGTSVLTDEVISFIESVEPPTPFFAYIATHAPHQPAIPAPGDGHLFSSLPSHRPRSYNESDVSDKPAYVRATGRITRESAARIDSFRLAQIRALQGVDASVADIVEELRAVGMLRRTLIVFMSDNGMLWGEHRLDGKGVIYEEAIGVPFVVRYDTLIHQPRSDDHLVLNIDLAPTFAEAGGLDPPQSDGRSLVPMLDAPEADWRTAFLIEHLRPEEDDPLAPTFCAIHTGRYVLVRYETDERELYDLRRDPLEMVNRDGRSAYHDVGHRLGVRLRGLCDPAPPGYPF